MKNLLIIFALFFTIHGVSQLPKGDRVLSWQLDLHQNDDYDSSFLYGKQACMEAVHLFMTWNDLETTSGVFNDTGVATLKVMNLYYPAASTPVEFQFAPLNTLFKSVPSDLQSISFNSPTMIARFKNVIDTVFKYIPNVDLTAFNIGNECDLVLGIDSNKYNEYKEFLDSVIPYVKQKYFTIHGTNLKIGTTLTHHGLVANSTKALCKKLNKNLDIVATTYYPLNSDFTMKNPNVVMGDFNALVSEYSDTSQPIYFVECGYSSSDSCNSNELQQAQFYKNVFEAWDSNYNSIKLITIFKLVDWSQAQANQLGIDYGLTDIKFIEYLRTLGVRTWDGNGRSKPAYFQIMCELRDRNWCVPAFCQPVSINENKEDKDILIYPNPVHNQLTISSPTAINSARVYNSQGKLVLVTQQNQVDLSNMKNGLYFISVKLENDSYINKKVIKN